MYLSFPFSDEDLELACKQILVRNESVDKLCCSYKENVISDYDMTFQVSKYSFQQKLAENVDYDIIKEE